MKKFTAMVGQNKIISAFALHKVVAIRIIEIQLRGRPGRVDLYKRWVDGGKVVVEE